MAWYFIVLLVVLALLVLSAAFWFILSVYFFKTTILHKEKQITPDEADRQMGTHWGQFTDFLRERRQWFDTQSLEKVSVTARDGVKLSGYYLENNPSNKKIVIAFHGYSSKGTNDFSACAYFYHRIGCNMLIVDERAHGESGGQYIGFGVLDRFDALQWIEYVNDRFGRDCAIILHGISMGGSTVLMASGLELPENVKAIVADCAFTSAHDVFAHVLREWYHLPSYPILKITGYLSQKKAGYRYDECSTLDAVTQTKVPILFIHGGKDTFVPTWMTHENYKACASEKEILIIENAAHGESFFMENGKCEKTIEDFIQKHC